MARGEFRANFKIYSDLIDVRTFHSMTRQQAIREQAEQANYEAIQGGKDGAIRWFLGGVIVFGTAQLVWPFYRRLTTPFKVETPTALLTVDLPFMLRLLE
jgi:hypothetical protein